jgi:NADPH:quinone reductase-like Zn-dependent oxidoreductase
MLELSWSEVRKGGLLVSVVSGPSPEKASSLGVKGAFFIVEPNRTELIRIGELIDLGRIKPIIENAFPLEEARRAYEKGQSGHNRGKTVLQVINLC